MKNAPTSPPHGRPSSGEHSPGGRRLCFALGFAAVTVGACVLLGRRFTHTSWPLERAHMSLVAGAIALYFSSYVLRALGWQKLFPSAGRPDRARCLAACGAAAASGAVLPFRLDYLVKIGTLRRMSGVKLGLEAIALSIISLGIVDAIAFLPLSISATATSSGSFRLPLIGVVLFGVCCCGLLVGGRRLAHLPIVARHARLAKLRARVLNHPRSTTREAIAAWLFLLGCWTSRALGSTLLLAALGVGFSPTLALIVLCLSAAASLIPIASGAAVANVSATAAILLALGVHKEAAINFGLASGLLLCATAAVAAVVGVAASVAIGLRAQLIGRVAT
jgi:lysylphosphatidylglycerol synthase-like protein